MAKSFREREFERLMKTTPAPTQKSSQPFADQAYANAVQRYINDTDQQSQQTPIQSATMKRWEQQSPVGAQTMKDYQAFLRANGILPQEELDTLTSRNFYKPTSFKQAMADPNASRTAYLDRLMFINNHRQEGKWDVEGNSPNMLSDNYLAELIETLNGRLEQSKKDDKTAELKRIHDGYDPQQPFDLRAQSLLDAYNLTRGDNAAAPATWDELRELDDEEYYYWLNTTQQHWQNIDWDTLGLDDYHSETAKFEKQLKEAEKERDMRTGLAKYDQLIGSMDNAESLATYRDNITQRDPIKGLPVYNVANYADQAYFINNSQYEMTSLMSRMGKVDTQTSLRIQDYYNKGYNYLTPDEVVKYNTLYNSSDQYGAGIAQGYLDTLQPELERRRAEVDYVMNESFTEGMPLVSDMASLGAGLVNSMAYPFQIAETKAGHVSPYAAGYDYANAASTIRTTRDQQLANVGWANKLSFGGKNVLQHIYGAGMSAADNALRRRLGGRAGSLILAGMGSASSTLQENAARDEMSNDAKIVSSLLNGALEAATENMGLDEFLNMGQESVAKYLGSMILPEIGEEVINLYGSELIEAITSQIYGHEAELMDDGERRTELLNTIVDTALSTLMSGVPGAFAMTSQNKAMVNQVNQNGNMDAVINIAKSLGEDSPAKRLADKLTSQKGRKMRVNEAGALIRQVTQEVGTQNAQAVQQVLDQDIAARMIELGTDAKEARAVAPTVRKLFLGEKVSAWDSGKITFGNNAKHVLQELYQPYDLDMTAYRERVMQEETQKRGEQAPITEDEIRQLVEQELTNEMGGRTDLTEDEIRQQVEEELLAEEGLAGAAFDENVAAEYHRMVEERRAENPDWIPTPGYRRLAAENVRRRMQQEQDSQDSNREELIENRVQERLQEQQAFQQRVEEQVRERMQAQKSIASRVEERVRERMELQKNFQQRVEERVRERMAQQPEEEARTRAEIEEAVEKRSQTEQEKRIGGHVFHAKTMEKLSAAQMRMTELSDALGRNGKKATRQAEETAADTTTETEAAPPTGKAVEEAQTAAKQKQDAVSDLNLGEKMVAFDDDEGNDTKGEFQRVELRDGQLVAVVKQDGKDDTTMVDLRNIEGTGSEAMTTILQYAQDATHTMSPAQINSMIGAYEAQGGDVGKYIQDYEDAFMAGYTGMEQGNPPEGIQAIAYTLGAAEAQVDESERVKRVKQAKRETTGEVTWIGQVSEVSQVSGKGAENSLQEAMRTLSASQKQAVQLVSEFAKRFKTDIVLYQSTGDDIMELPNGQYIPETNTIYLDVNGGANTTQDIADIAKNGTLGNAMVRYFGHELTHALESGSAVGYAAYRQAVRESLRKRNISYEALVRNKLETAISFGQKLTLGGAEAEVIADASEYMLQNTEFVRKAPKSVKNTIKSAIKDFSRKVREVFTTLTGGHRESLALRELNKNMLQYVDGLQQKWDIAAEEMVNGAQTQQNQQDVQQTQTVEDVQQNQQDVQQTETVEELDEGKQFARRDDMTMLDVRQIMGGMRITDKMNDTEKDMLTRYQSHLTEMQKLEQQIAEQKAIIDSDEASDDEKTAAKARMRIFDRQRARHNGYLRKAEGSGGFARLMATSRSIVRTLASENLENAAETLATQISSIQQQLETIGKSIEKTKQSMDDSTVSARFDQREIRAEAKRLKNLFSLSISEESLRNRIATLWSIQYAMASHEATSEQYLEELTNLATDIYEAQKPGANYESATMINISDELGSLQLSDSEIRELKSGYGISFLQYKNMLAPYIKVTKGGKGSEILSKTESDRYYGAGGTLASIMEDVVNDVDALMILYDTAASEKDNEDSKNLPGLNRRDSIKQIMLEINVSWHALEDSELANRLNEVISKSSGDLKQDAAAIDTLMKETGKAAQRAGNVAAGVYKQTFNAMQAVEYYRKLEEQRRLMELKEQKEAVAEQLKKSNAGNMEAIWMRLDRQKELTEQQKQKRKGDAQARKIKADTEKRIRSIRKKTRKLSDRLVNATDSRHIPPALQNYINRLLRTFADSSLQGFAFKDGETATLIRDYDYLFDDVEAGADVDIANTIENLAYYAEQYQKIRSAVKGSEYKDVTYRSLEGVSLENAIVKEVEKIMDNAFSMVSKLNSTFSKNRHMTFKEFAVDATEEIMQKPDKSMRSQAVTALNDAVVQGNLTPVYFFEHMGNKALSDIFAESTDAMRKTNKIVREAQAFFESVMQRYHVAEWQNDKPLYMTTQDAEKIELTRGLAMSLYATYKREQINTLTHTHHLLTGGFEYENVRDIGNGHRGKPGTHRLNDIDMGVIANWLTDEQKACADEIVKYLSTTLADYGNEATMELYGYKKFLERYYFPFRSSRTHSPFKVLDNTTGQKRVSKQGFTHSVKRSAGTPVIIGDFFTSTAEHAYEMAYLAGTAVTAEKFGHILNYKIELENDKTMRYKELIKQKYGENAYKYLEDFIRDLNGRQQNDNRHLKAIDDMTRNFRRTAVMYNMSVVVQQPMSVFRAFAYINPKYFANAFTAQPMQAWHEMLRYSGAAIAKDVGGYNVGMGKGGGQYIRGNDSVGDVYGRYDNKVKASAKAAAHAISNNPVADLPQTMDILTWSYIWNAAKNEQAARHPNMDRNSEEFLEMCGKRADDVLMRTQVFDSVLTRSGWMRSTNKAAKGLTAFMAEPTLTANMLFDAFTNKKYTAGQRARVVGSVFLSITMTAAASALAQMFRKDDDERTVLERFAGAFVSNLSESIDPFSMLPFVDSIQAALSGEEITQDEFANIVSTSKAINKFFGKIWSGEQITWKDAENTIGGIANIFGIPVKNVSREMRSIYNAATADWTKPSKAALKYTALDNIDIPTISVAESLGSFDLWDTSNSAYYKRIAKAYAKGDMDKAQEIQEYLVNSKGVSEKTIKTQSKAALKTIYMDGELDRDEAEAILMDVYGETEANAYWTVEEWQYKTDNGADADYRKYDDLFSAVESGENLKSTIKSYTDNGVSKQTLSSQVTSKYMQQLADLWAAGKKSDYANLLARVLTAYEVMGYNRSEKKKDIERKRDEIINANKSK